MKNRVIVLLGILGGIILTAAGIWWWQSQTATAQAADGLEASGEVEARRASLAPEVGGLVLDALVEEGEQVVAGQPLVRLDSALLVAQREQAAAALQAALANLALLEAGATDEQLAAARAGLAQAEANLQLAQAGFFALTAGTRPETITALHTRLEAARQAYMEMQVVFTSEQLEAVREVRNTAAHNLSNVQSRLEDLESDETIPSDILAIFQNVVHEAGIAGELADEAETAVLDKSRSYTGKLEVVAQVWEYTREYLTLMQARTESVLGDERGPSKGQDALEVSLRAAEELESAARAANDSLNQGAPAEQLAALWQEVGRLQAALGATAQLASPQNPPSAVSVDSLLAQVDIAAAGRDQALANLLALQRGARDAELGAARAQVDAARAQLAALDVQLSKFILTAPWDGIVLGRSVEPGETVLPGTIVLEIGRLDTPELTVYLAEAEFGRVTLGQTVEVRVDAYPDRLFTGTVLRIADQAEFTPTNVQTKEDRARLVYAITLGLDNPDLALKPGMIADVTFGP